MNIHNFYKLFIVLRCGIYMNLQYKIAVDNIDGTLGG